MKKIIEILLKLSKILDAAAWKLTEISILDEFYVFVPTRSKPVYKHSTYKSARQEAERIAAKLDGLERVQILHIVDEINGELPPF